MAINEMAWQWGWAQDRATLSLQVNFSPRSAVAQCSLSQAVGAGLCAGGITEFRTRARPDGPDTVHHVKMDTDTYWLVPVEFDQHMSSVSAHLDVGGDQGGTMTLMVSLWA